MLRYLSSLLLVLLFVLPGAVAPAAASYLDEDSGRIVFETGQNGNFEIDALSVSDGSVEVLVEGLKDIVDFDVSPDGRQVVFTPFRQASSDLYVTAATSADLIRLTENKGNNDWPVWSPDGQRLAFESDRSGNIEIYGIDADGSNLKRLTKNGADNRIFSWSPDGSQIAFTSYRDGNAEIYVMDADGSHQTRLTNDEASDFYPSWSPDGSRIAFASERSGNLDVYVMDADGSNLTRLTDSDAFEGNPKWSPDGEHIAFASDQNYDVIDADGTHQTQVASDYATNGYDYSWSPDGQQIAFVSDDEQIHIVGVDGTNERTLSAITQSSPQWLP